jgi:NodT family efflux transporter outer membrane factor (OMF) lipoprotein
VTERRSGSGACWVAAILASLLTAGCAAGPDFVRPPPPPAYAAYVAQLPPAIGGSHGSAGGVQQLEPGAALPAHWWTAYRCAPLDHLVAVALARNPTLDAARAALAQAQEELAAGRGGLYAPQVNAALGATRERASAGSAVGPRTYDVFNASVQVAYSPDVFGAARRQVEGLAAGVDLEDAELAAARTTVVTNVVTTAIAEAAIRAQLAATDELIESQSRALRLVEGQARFGAATLADVLASRTQLATTVASRPPLERTLLQTRNALAALTGRYPGDAHVPVVELDALTLPADLPVSVPSTLVRTRPDIRAAEAALHVASAAVGVATADLYPQLTLSASLGSAAGTVGRIGGAGTSVWSLASGLLQPVFHGGELRARRRAAEDAYDESFASYRSTVLGAFQDVADALAALESDAATLSAQVAAEDAAATSLDLAERQLAAGAIPYLVLLNAQQAHARARLATLAARAERQSDVAALFHALGAGP